MLPMRSATKQVRFEMCAQALDSKITTIAPWRDPEFLERFKVRITFLVEGYGVAAYCCPVRV